MFVYDTPQWLDDILGLPFVGPIVGLLRSRKFFVGLGGVAAAFAVHLFPAAQPYAVEISVVVAGLAAFLIGAIAYEDGKVKVNTSSVTIDGIEFGEELAAVITEMVLERLEEEIPVE